MLGQGARANRGDGMLWARHNRPVVSARSSVSPQAPKGAAASFSAAVVTATAAAASSSFTHPPSRLRSGSVRLQLTGLESRHRVPAWILCLELPLSPALTLNTGAAAAAMGDAGSERSKAPSLPPRCPCGFWG